MFDAAVTVVKFLGKGEVMLQTRAPDRPRADGALNFEYTSTREARRSLEELPPGVASLPTFFPEYWDRFRRAPVASDIALSAVALDWLMQLPPGLRPQALCGQFPRIANAIASAWSKVDARDALFASLLVDRRGNRRGFPAKVREEIAVLRSVSRSRWGRPGTTTPAAGR